MKKSEEDTEIKPSKVTDIDSAQENVEAAVAAFTEQWIPLPEIAMPFEMFDVGQLRDMMGLRATIDVGDPWPQAENLLVKAGFRFRQVGTNRVLVVREKDDCIYGDWEEAEEVE